MLRAAAALPLKHTRIAALCTPYESQHLPSHSCEKGGCAGKTFSVHGPVGKNEHRTVSRGGTPQQPPPGSHT
ncbi:hypothetical protein F751_2357 [Auxenochlorella protothecoides]|uniref:Uncharacterized protein n=1 Tax=Auxenochlorella protothecoides TaxID=3075 RepID=A0A087SFY5_AUXPR|nr:hypothetical protein F751_2357 [Auxenochlorella protothecoides]KFM24639.1 hypothetical protein F751_2357 [Auxenochlorella protothecoides]